MFFQFSRMLYTTPVVIASLLATSSIQAKSVFNSDANASQKPPIHQADKSVLHLAAISTTTKPELSWDQLEHQRKSQQLITLSGFSSLITQVPMHFDRGVTDALLRNQITSAQQHNLLEKARQALLAADIQQQLADAVAAELSNSEMDTLLSWYHSEAGQKISAAQAYAASEKGFADMMSQAGKLLSEQRLMSLATVLDKQLNFIEFIVDLQEYQAFAEYSTQRSYLAQPLQRKQFEQKMTERYEELHFNAEQLVTISLAYAFKDISEPEVEAYQQFLQQPLSQSYLKAAMAGLKTGMERVVENWLDNIDFHIASD